MIIELTILTDEGEPFILDGASVRMVIKDKKNGDQIQLNTDVRVNKIIHYVDIDK